MRFIGYFTLIGQIQVQLNLFNIDNHPDKFCLLHYIREDIFMDTTEYVLSHQIIPYCLRSSEGNIPDLNLDYINNDDPALTFLQLKEQNITSEQLLSWSISIDLAERYEMFLNDISNSSIDREMLFYNCTFPSFGPLCRFIIERDDKASFDDIVELHFGSKSETRESSNTTCYVHLKCETSSVCLDWREICDKKIHCIDGSDEIDCWQLELNECTVDEYRCHNGQCIPKEFFHDVIINPDCLDQSDEGFLDRTSDCFVNPLFRCEEHTCQPGREDFPCGDGQCTVGIYGQRGCKNGRDRFSATDRCSLATACLMRIYTDFVDKWCDEFCPNNDCVTRDCSALYEFSYGPIFAEYARFLFVNKDWQIGPYNILLPHYICYNEMRLPNFRPAKEYLNNTNCRRLDVKEVDEYWHNSPMTFPESLRHLFRAYFVGLNETHHCNHLTMYQCKNSIKCISVHRLRDGIQDCPLNDDETFNRSCSLVDAHRRFACLVNGSKVCFAPFAIDNTFSDCTGGEDEFNENEELLQKQIYFQKLCDGIEELVPVLIDDNYETDETNCNSWLCNNTYTRCDRFWSCKNGADEVNCPPSTCPIFQHRCVFPNDTSKISCLPISQADDGIIDCLGASDEPSHCRSVDSVPSRFRFSCSNYSDCLVETDLCNNYTDCPFHDDEVFCTTYDLYTYHICHPSQGSMQTDVENFLCSLIDPFESLENRLIFFQLKNIPTYLVEITTDIELFELPNPTEIPSIRRTPTIKTEANQDWYCNRGIPLQIRMTNETNELHCLCPPSYYGSQCQYQNQRVSLTIQIRATSDWNHLFTFLILLIDNEGNIESHDFIEYLPVRDCDTKFNLYLLYSTRPKNPSKTYSIRIDAFLKVNLRYRASWIFLLQFSLLPVHRFSTILIIPHLDTQPVNKCIPSCLHGQCFPYVNNQTSTFCRCETDWSGLQCTIEKKCICTFNSICVDGSICVCPLHRFGPRCYLKQFSCHTESCVNNGQCIPIDERYKLLDLKRSTCVCPLGYSGNQCEYQLNQTRIEIWFDDNIPIPSSLLIHFIRVQNDAAPISTSMMKTIAFYQFTLSFSITNPFNIAFAKIFNDYYLILLREQIIISANISTKVSPSHRCSSIHELFNETLVSQHLLKRMKYYHLPCQTQQQLICFYDEIHFCLCDLHRRANCFEFNHNITYNCHGYNLCENGGQCFQDDKICPTRAICGCSECYYGSKCQFSTIGSTLSLDVILGYQIYPNITINQQPMVIRVTIVLSSVMFSFGFIGNILSLITFQRETTRNVGCGLYLFASSIVSMIIMSIFTIKFWFLLTFQMDLINNRLLILIQCSLLDFLLRFLVSFNDWLSACVAIERAVNISKGIKFNKLKSKQIAKWMILFVFFFTICSYIHDPVHRHLIDDEEEQRTWCITKYSSILKIFDRSVNIVHFFIPFFINFVSALIIILYATRTRSKIQKKHSRKTIFYEQFHHHKHLLIAPIVLALLAFPRLIISFLFGCMKSARNPWLYLTGYFISFIPPMMIFTVFVLPSQVYREEFIQSIKQIRSK
ncbi:unnamed protein product [Adineta ricciae]|uniref:Uncharacterized protein n=1 Tax=Adineta ricciae TaxID=249248 RepID=A0A815LJ94_ADIRI|nr:unnamed protein product [Adineta ricciae]